MSCFHGSSVLTSLLILDAIWAPPAVATLGDWHQVFSRGVDICKVQAQSSLGGAHESLRVVALGSWRAVAFGNATDVETTVKCTSQDSSGSSDALPVGCTAWPEDREPVSDVS